MLSTVKSSFEQLPTLADFVSQEKTLQVPYHMLKPAVRNPGFYGRQEILQQIDTALLPKSQKQETSQEGLQLFALCGLGGVGKTQVATEYAFSRRSSYDAIFWVEADEPTQLAEGFARIAAQLGFTDASDKDRVVSRKVALEWLSSPLKRRIGGSSTFIGSLDPEHAEATWLLVFNNADNLDLLRNYWPLSSYGSILITTRDPFARRARPGVDLDCFPTSDAAALLRKSLTSSNDTPENLESSNEDS